MPKTKNSDIKYHRVQLDFSEEALDELNELQRSLKASSRAEVVRHGLGVLKWLDRHIKNGDKIKIEKEGDGELVEVEFPFITAQSTSEALTR